VALETRFARAASGPVPYRIDGSGSRQLLIISDWAQPYGEPGVGAFDTFARALAASDARAITLLDGTIEGTSAKRPDIERRLVGARTAAEATELSQATLLGAGGGGPVAALLAAQEPSRFARLILYDTFPPETKKAWALGASADTAETVADLQKLESELKTAGAAWEWAQSWFKTKGKGSGKPLPGDVPFPGVTLPDVSGSDVPPPPFGQPPGLKDGLAQLLQHVASLEGPGRPNQGPGLSAITIPTVVIEVRTDGEASSAAGSLAMQVAAEIPGAIHRAVDGRSRWPWGEGNPSGQVPLIAPGDEQMASVGAAPKQIAAEPERVLATVLFTDIVGSTERLTELGDAAWRQLLARHHQAVRDQLARFDGREIDTAGDGFLAAFDAPARAVRCAVAIRDDVKAIGVNIRCGLHTGECEQVGDKLVGIAVHIGARIAWHAAADEILVSSTVRDLVAGAGISFDDRGAATLKGLPGEWLLFAVTAVR
jgi:class 3 adenylate cyclase/pimeloyl-ACP methyl ester carboxylesterase